MNKDDVIRMAREARIEQDGEMLYSFRNSDKDQDVHISDLERFAALVAEAERRRLASAIEAMPFGDTAASFAVWIRDGGKA